MWEENAQVQAIDTNMKICPQHVAVVILVAGIIAEQKGYLQMIVCHLMPNGFMTPTVAMLKHSSLILSHHSSSYVFFLYGSKNM